MKQNYTIKEKSNCLVISLMGDQNFIKIFDASGKLMRYDQNPGVTTVYHTAPPGGYSIETNGTITKVASRRLDIATLGSA